MPYKLLLPTFIGVAVLAVAAPVLAGPADQVRARTAGFHDLGAAFKAVTDTFHAAQPQVGVVQQSAVRIAVASQNIYHWFPAGSGPQAGVKTAAKPEIWSQPGQFRTAQDAFAREAATFQRVAASGNLGAIRTEYFKLGATCKSCHDTFRQSDD